MSFEKWNSVNWPLVEERVFRYQQRIYRASQNGNKKVIRNLQHRVLTSLDSKLLAVRQVTIENNEINTLVVDKKMYTTPEDKIKLALSLKVDGKVKSIKKGEILEVSRPDQKRPLDILTVKDLAKQALCHLALEPEWEAVFEADSYGFRPGRSCHDAIQAAFETLSKKGLQSQYRKLVLKVNIEKCFDPSNHRLLLTKLDNNPIIQKQVKAWLRAGILKGSSFKESLQFLIKNETIISKEEIISPLLSNIVLHGLINHLKTGVNTIQDKNNQTVSKQSDLIVIRYASDILVIHKDKTVISRAKHEIENWLWKHSKLSLNQEKTKIYNSTQGFDFLGFTLTSLNQNGTDRLKIYPSRIEQANILLNFREVIKRNKATSAYRLITILKPKLLEWGNYYRYSECKLVFSKISYYIYQKLRAWAFRIDKRHGRKIVKEKYFPSRKSYYFEESMHDDNWILYGKEKDRDGKIREIFLPRLSWIKSKKWVKVKNTKSPFDGDRIYWTARLISYRRLSKRVSKLLKRQQGFCPYCKTRFYLDSVMEVDHIQPKALGGKDTNDNLQLLHNYCHIQKTRIDRINIVLAKIRQ